MCNWAEVKAKQREKRNEEANMANLTIRGLRKSFGAVEILKGIDLDIKSGEFMVFVGPSGCGKSTLLRVIAGLEQVTSGTISFDDEVVNDVPPADRGIAMVFQSYALYPHMTVYENMAFGLKMGGASKSEIDERVRKAADMLQVTPLLDRLPKQLSGGQRQRVAIGRAITRDPQVFLFDEPLSNLDAALRVATRIEIARLKEGMPDTTMIYVTHDQVEAMTLADRIVVLNAGHIEQVGTPLELYHKPANRFVAGFIGSPAMNFVTAYIEAAGTKTKIKTASGHTTSLPYLTAKALEGQSVSIGVRPEDLQLVKPAEAIIKGKVEALENLGELKMAYCQIGEAEPLIVKLPGDSAVARGDAISLGAAVQKIHMFHANGISLAQSTS
jgi:alpha-glucoside transport system ATP-binding protein